MNLVAKKFLTSRHDEQGVLVLNCFIGAARELRDALQVNPYDVNQTAEAIRIALRVQSLKSGKVRWVCVVYRERF